MRYFIRVINTITPANRLQDYVLARALEWNCCLIAGDKLEAIPQDLERAIKQGIADNPRCKPLALSIPKEDGKKWESRSYFIGLPMTESNLIAIVATPIRWEYGKEKEVTNG